MKRAIFGAVFLWTVSAFQGFAAEPQAANNLTFDPAIRSSLSLKGETNAQIGRYLLSLAYTPATSMNDEAAIVIYAEPSHRALLVHWNSDADAMPGAQAIKEALASEHAMATTESSFGGITPTAAIPFEPKGDERIVGYLLTTSGARARIFDGKVNVERFQFEFSFDETREKDAGGKVVPLFRRQRACSGCGPPDPCPMTCDFCDGPSFLCVCPGCKLTCL